MFTLPFCSLLQSQLENVWVEQDQSLIFAEDVPCIYVGNDFGLQRRFPIL